MNLKTGALMLLVGSMGLLGGCTMSNDDVIREVKKCQGAGLTASVVWDGFGNRGVLAVACMPKIKECK